MTKDERMKEIVKASPDFGKRVGYKMCVVDEFHDIKELLEENAELKKQIENFQKYLDSRNCYRGCAETWEKLTKAKEIIRNLLRVTYGEGWNYSLDVKVQAEQFLANNF